MAKHRTSSCVAALGARRAGGEKQGRPIGLLMATAWAVQADELAFPNKEAQGAQQPSHEAADFLDKERPHRSDGAEEPLKI